ncbi:hypothetical protein C7974DRAFT_398888 [Boeremia exigua]|uniref:uncharacterized protein n=1 Tax=Boeremia exigua TaxID=749465 RepID=UPI001E8DCB98|nr:uncharacterized protein C7974DRAFT_398888 [Boeremia exigua]KAH6620093.1 hypothetical protein C7974DRAFT_398888 [Boeremia exigua]
MPPPQQYGAWPSHSQHAPHPQYQPYNQPYPPKQPPQSRPPPPKSAPPPAPGPASTPAPDPVIHMLAARAGTDPELKAVMKIVAAGAASKAQLEFFQTHINELTEILEKNKKAKAPMPLPAAPSKQPSMPVSVQSASPAPKQSSTPAPPKQSSTPAPPKQSSTPAPKPSTPAAPKQESASPAPAKQPAVAASPAPAPLRQAPTPTPPRPAPPVQQQPPAPAPKPFSPAPPQTQQRPPPPQPRPHPPNAYPVKNYQPPYYQQPPPHYAQQPPPRITYRPLTFEFVEGNGDRFYFPSYSFMEWLPNGSGAKFSFLVTKLKPKPDVADKAPSTPAPPPTPTPAAPATDAPFPPAPPGSTAAPAPPPAPAYVAPPRIEDFDERNDMKDVDFYQPVTVLVLTDEHEVKSALPRAIRPPSVVEKYMEEVFDTCRRAEDTYLAFRLPKGGTEVDAATKSGHATPSAGTPTADVVMGGVGAGAEKRKSVAGRPRKSLPA